MLELKPLEAFYSFCKDKQCYYICFSPQEFLEQAGKHPPLPLPPSPSHRTHMGTK